MDEQRDPFEPHLKKAAALFEAGDIVKAGQIWQAILKRVPGHPEARKGLYQVKLFFDSRATQGGLEGAEAGAVPHPVPPRVDPEVPRLLQAGCALYDAGKLEEAIGRWEEVLARDPHNALALGYVETARRSYGLGGSPSSQPERSPVAPPPERVPEASRTEEVERLVRDGCTLFDMGQTQDALLKWEQAQALAPDHSLVRGYVQDARRELGLPLEGPSAPRSASSPESAQAPRPSPMAPQESPSRESPIGGPAVPTETGEAAAELVLQGVQLYDMGMTPEAVQKWEQALRLVPGHAEARGYLDMAARDAHPAPPPPVPQPVQGQEEKLRIVERLMDEQRAREAIPILEQVLRVSPGHPRAIRRLEQAIQATDRVRRPQVPEVGRGLIALGEASAAPGPVPAPPFPGESSPPSGSPAAAHPVELAPDAFLPPPPPPGISAATGSALALPQALQAPRDAKGRKVEIPALLGQAVEEIPKPLKTPKVVVSLVVAVLLVNLTVCGINRRHATRMLEKSVESFRAQALASAQANLQVQDFQEGPRVLLKEAASSLEEDPLVAFYRATEAQRLEPGNPEAAALVQKARTALAASEPPSATLKAALALLEDQNLDQAETLLVALLRQAPEDADLRALLARVSLALAQTHATKERWQDAEIRLRRYRALVPADRSAPLRLHLLQQIKGMAPAQRKTWLPFLG